MLHRLGHLIHRQARWFALGWLTLVLLGFAAATGALGGQSLFERLAAGDVPQVPGESQVGQQMINRAGDDGQAVLLIVDGVDPADPALAAVLATARPGLAALPNVTAVADPYAPPVQPVQRSPFVSVDAAAVLVSVSMDAGLDAAAREATLDTVEAGLRDLGAELAATAVDGGASYRVGGLQQLVDEINYRVEQDLRVGEAVALPLSLLVMVVVFGGLLAAGLPILGAVASIAGGLTCLLAFSYAIELDASVPSVVSVLGLGLCIDYGLLLVSRYREELRRLQARAADTTDTDTDTDDLFVTALERTLGTAGRTVLFSGITVAISLCGLLFFRASILRAVGAAGVSVVVVAVLVALTMVPALLALAGPRMLRPGITHRIPGLRRVARRLGDVAPPRGVFSRLATWVQRRPLLVAAACLAVLATAALPLLRIEIVSSGVSLLPATSPERRFMEDLAEQFPATSQAPILVVATAEAAQLSDWAERVATLDGVASLDPVTTVGQGPQQVSVLGVRTDSDPRLSQAREVVGLLREALDQNPPTGVPRDQVWVTGESAQVYDFIADVRARAPLAISVVVLATFVLLFLMTGSVLVPLKALVMNIVSLGASFGVLVWVFQDGHLEGLLGFTSNGGIDQNIPALALAFAFGLSMDYEVFLLSRIKESRDGLLAGAQTVRRRPPNDLAVRDGLQRSGRIITSAALIVVLVFAGFVAGQLLLIKQIGVALAVAVAVDATVVRMLLVPATMTLLGEWNWWAPGPLRRLHDRFGVREG